MHGGEGTRGGRCALFWRPRENGDEKERDRFHFRWRGSSGIGIIQKCCWWFRCIAVGRKRSEISIEKVLGDKLRFYVR